MTTKTKKRKIKKASKFSFRKPTKYRPGGMYEPNTIEGAGRGSTEMTVWEESNPAIQEAREQKFANTAGDLAQKGDAMVAELKGDKEQSKVDVEQAALKTKQKADALGAGIGSAAELGTQVKDIATNVAKKKAAKLAAKKASEEATKKLAAEAAKKQAALLAKEKAAAMATQQAAKAGAGEVTKVAAGEVSKEVVKAGTTEVAKTAGTEVVKTAGQEVAKEVAKEGTKKVAETAVAGAAGAGAGAAAAGSFNPNPYAMAANIVGKGISMGFDDGDATTWNAGEATGDILGSAGEYAGYGAMIGSIFPGPGNVIGAGVGAVVGAAKGVITGLVARGKARKEERVAKRKAQDKADKYNKKIGEQLSDQMVQVRAGEMKQKTYSGYDLGRNIAAKKGGYRSVPKYI